MTDTAAKYYIRRIDRAGTVHGQNSYGAKKILGQVSRVEGGGWKNNLHGNTFASQNEAARALQEEGS